MGELVERLEKFSFPNRELRLAAAARLKRMAAEIEHRQQQVSALEATVASLHETLGAQAMELRRLSALPSCTHPSAHQDAGGAYFCVLCGSEVEWRAHPPSHSWVVVDPIDEEAALRTMMSHFHQRLLRLIRRNSKKEE